jgi:hypothetical protein
MFSDDCDRSIKEDLAWHYMGRELGERIEWEVKSLVQVYFRASMTRLKYSVSKTSLCQYHATILRMAENKDLHHMTKDRTTYNDQSVLTLFSYQCILKVQLHFRYRIFVFKTCIYRVRQKKYIHTLTDGICVLFSKLNYHYNM